MFVGNLIEKCDNLKKLARESGTFAEAYDYWKEYLAQSALHLFHWKNTGDVPEHEIETYLMFNGILGTKQYNGKDAVFMGDYAGGTTIYYDTYEDFSIHSPIYSGIFKIGKEITVIKNNSLCNSILPLIHRTAILLAHTEVSLINTLINGRDSGGIPVVSTTAQKTAVEQYRNDLCNGKVTSIHDPAFSAVQFLSVNKNTTLSIKDLMEIRQNILDGYYEALGIKTSHEKKGNKIEAEVDANDTKLMMNLSDMLECRKKGAEEHNKLFGGNWEVELAPELQYFNEDNKEKEVSEDGEM